MFQCSITIVQSQGILQRETVLLQVLHDREAQAESNLIHMEDGEEIWTGDEPDCGYLKYLFLLALS
jgi:hypothetical protein